MHESEHSNPNLKIINEELDRQTPLAVPEYDRKIDFDVLTHFKYPIEELEDAFIKIAMTRPETMLDDTGIAVNSKDERYKHITDKSAKHPFIDHLLPIVADDYAVVEFETRAVKITPANGFNDFTMGPSNPC